MATTRISGKTELLGADIQNNDVMLIEHDLSGDDADKKIKFSTLKTAITSDIKDGQSIDSFADVETALSGIQNGQSINNFGGVETALSSKVSTSQTAGLLKNDGTVDTNTYATTSQLPDVSTKADLTDLAPSFSTSTAYAVGDYVVYNSDVYRCKTAHSAGAWNSSHFTKVAVATEINSRPSFEINNNYDNWYRDLGNGVYEFHISLSNVELIRTNEWKEYTKTFNNAPFVWSDTDYTEIQFFVTSVCGFIKYPDFYPISVWVKTMETENQVKFAIKVDNSNYINDILDISIHFIAKLNWHD